MEDILVGRLVETHPSVTSDPAAASALMMAPTHTGGLGLAVMSLESGVQQGDDITAEVMFFIGHAESEDI